MDTVPNILYKYTSAEVALLMLNSTSIKLSPPCCFNDPFEILPGGYDDLEDSVLKQMAERKCKSIRYYNIITSQLGLNVAYEAYLEHLNITPTIVDDVAQSLKKAFENRDFRELRAQLSNQIALACFSGTRDNILMWSHYGNQHKGVVLGFKKEISPTWHKVLYSNDRVIIPFGADPDSTEYKDAVERILSTKEKNWEYEEEYRYFKKLDKLEYKNSMYFDSFDSVHLAEVIFGVNVTETDKHCITKAIENFADIDIKLFQSGIDNKDYKINIQQIGSTYG